MNVESLLTQIRSLPHVHAAEIRDYPGSRCIVVTVTPSYQDDDPNNGYTVAFRAETETPISALVGDPIDAGMEEDGSGREWWLCRMSEVATDEA